ncbi:MAG: universal stress protein [Thermoleophilia bacterium]|nr:universal stress protein [Thermoleophilia bacterium]
MTYKRILLATDGSDHARRAAQEAVQLAQSLGAEVTVLSVAIVHPMYGGIHLGPAGAKALEEHAEHSAELAAEDTSSVLAQKGVPAKAIATVTHHGKPAEAILKTAEEIGADLIVMGSRGLGRASSVVMGSTSQGVIHEASIPVLVVH